MFGARDDLSRSVSGGSQPSTMVSGTSAREEGLRTLTSPRREASLFKLGRNLRVLAIFFNAEGLRGPIGVPACTNSVGSCAQRAAVHSCIAGTHWGAGKYKSF